MVVENSPKSNSGDGVFFLLFDPRPSGQKLGSSIEVFLVESVMSVIPVFAPLKPDVFQLLPHPPNPKFALVSFVAVLPPKSTFSLGVSSRSILS